ncbi:hypothetical protein HZS_2622 [Henneguya salminicola]|nr:hypothetical protein HZS_2622 [Henneguya salminicola]
MKVAQIVIGPAGCGKSTYASRMFEHLIDSKRCVCLVNLDPAAEEFICQPDIGRLKCKKIDIRELISLTDVMEDDEIKLGPNGGLIFCIELNRCVNFYRYLIKNIDWLFKKIDEFLCDYLIFDCPGQVELYTHMPSFRILLEHLKYNDFNVCAMYMIDSQFMVDPCKFIGGVVSALSAMVMFEVPHVNILTKIDLLDETMKSKLEDYLNFSSEDMLAELNQVIPPRYLRLNKELALLIDNYSLVSFHPVNYDEDDSLENLLIVIDSATQYGEDKEIQDNDIDLTNNWSNE